MRIVVSLICLIALLTQAHAQSAPESGESEETTCGVERWSVKDLSDSLASQINFTPVNQTVGELTSLPTVTPSSSAPRDTSEMHTYRVACFVRQFKVETDGDVHLVIVDTTDTSITMIAEIPDSSCPDAVAGGYASDFADARDSLIGISGLKPTTSWKYPAQPLLVTIAGVGYYDPPHGQTGKAPNNLEIHPVLAFNTYSPAAAVPADSISLVTDGSARTDSTDGAQVANVSVYVHRPGTSAVSVRLLRWEGAVPDTLDSIVLAVRDSIQTSDSVLSFTDILSNDSMHSEYTYAAEADSGSGWCCRSGYLKLSFDTVQLRFTQAPPVADDSVDEDSAYTAQFIAASDSDAMIRYEIDTLPSLGSTSIDSTGGMLTYIAPSVDSTRLVHLSIGARDNSGRRVSYTFTLTIVNRPAIDSVQLRFTQYPPVSGDSVNADSTYTTQFIAASDSGAVIRYELDSLPPIGVSSIDSVGGLFMYSAPSVDSTQTVHFVVDARDNTARSASYAFDLTIIHRQQNTQVEKNASQEPDSPFIEASPQPFSDRLNIAYTLPQPGSGDITLYDVYGDVIMKRQLSGMQGSGVFSIATAGLPSGMYMLELREGGMSLRQKVMCIK